jgi:hypothetical protein
MQNFPRLGTVWARLDSSTGNIMSYDTSCTFYGHEKLMDSLALKKSSYPYNYQGGPCGGTSNIYCRDTIDRSIFGITTKSKELGKFFFVNQYENYAYARDFGIFYYGEGYSAGSHFYSLTFALMGCIINGNVYGDTTMPITILEPVSTEIPAVFSLSQNYPNPFNPQTKIKFDVPANVRGQTSNVKLIIYDLLGREVATLVNEELKPGTYEADWDGSNFSSGVYFYKIISNEFTETRKMVLMK